MSQGPWTAFNAAKLKFLNGTISLAAHSFNVALLSSSQVISSTFTGTSGNAQYSDLTGELATAAGYTNGGQLLSSVTLTSSAGIVTFTSGNPTWSLTGGGITFKYATIFDVTAANKDLAFYCDMNLGGGSVSPIAGVLEILQSTFGIFNFD